MEHTSGPARLQRDLAEGRLQSFEHYLDPENAAAPLEVLEAFADAVCSAADDTRVVGCYRLKRLIGRGAFGTVYAAVHVASGRSVAVKVLHDHHGASPQTRERFQREVECVLRVQHPNLVRMLHGEVNREDPFLVMEYVPGESLATLLSRSRIAGHRMLAAGSDENEDARFARVLELIEAVARAVAALHAAHVVHRDVKPQNIIVTPDGTPILTDLGLAGVLDEDEGELLASGGVGTPSYMSPEQLDGAPAQCRSDVWALGVTLFECLTLERPFSGATRSDLARSIATQPPPRIRSVHPGLARDVDAVLATALAVEPRDRYENAQDLAEDLARLRTGQPLLCNRPRVLRRIADLARRHRRLVLVAALALLALLLVVFALQQRALAEEQARSSALLRRVVQLSRSAIDGMVETTASLGRFGFRLDERRKILQAASSELERIRDTGFDDPEVLLLLAKASRELGDLESRGGHPIEARQHLVRAVELVSGLSESTPPSGQLADLSVSLVKLGDLEGALGNSSERRRLYEQALGLDEHLVRAAPGNPRHLSDLANSYARLGYLSTQEKRLDDAARLLGQALEVQSQLQELAPENPIWLHDSTQFELLVVSNSLAREEPSVAQEHLSRAAALAQRLVDLAPTDPRSHTTLAVATTMRASTCPDAAKRLALATEALASAKRAAALAPDDPAILRTLANAWTGVGSYEVAVSGLDKALASYDAARSVLDEAAHLDPTSRDRFFSQVNLLLTVAGAARSSGATDLARKYAAQACEESRAAASDPGASERVVADALRFLVDPRAGDSANPALASELASRARARLGSVSAVFESALTDIRRTLQGPR